MPILEQLLPILQELALLRHLGWFGSRVADFFVGEGCNHHWGDDVFGQRADEVPFDDLDGDYVDEVFECVLWGRRRRLVGIL